MFFSHEILSNNQYGVATIWLIATVGKTGQRKLNRKTLQEVDIPRACGKILDPGAPLALRLQGNLLYGVSRVFSHQCNYVLSDAGKTQSDMMTFFRSMKTSETDEKAGKSKRQHIILQDDPGFDPMAMLPGLDKLLNSETLFNFTSTQESAGNYSQMSPLDNLNLASAATSRRSSFIDLDLPPSLHSVGSYRLPADLGRYSSPFNKGIQESEDMPEAAAFLDNEFDPICGVGLDFDANGNLIGILDDEPELPPLRGTSPDPLHTAGVTLPRLQNIPHQDDTNFVDKPILDLGEAALPDAEPFAAPPAVEERNTDAPTLTTETTDTGKAIAPSRASHRRKFQEILDQELRVPRDEFRGWTENYAANMLAARNKVKATTQAKAKRNALAFLYSKGLAHVGSFQRALGISHPLALDFAGTALKAHVLGLSADEIEDINPKRGRRRKPSEAFGDDNDSIRNVRQRIEEDEFALGEAPVPGDGLDLGHDTASELGLNAGAPLEDKHSSSFMPWSRQGSAAPGSASRALGSAQKSVTAPSPLVGSIDRQSDPVEGSPEVVGFDSQLSSMGFEQGLLALNFDAANDTFPSTQGLDTSSHRFLTYIANQAIAGGVPGARDTQRKYWVDFDSLASPDVHTKAIAAQAFLHVLSLATENVISVEQEGIENKKPFGALRVGLTGHVLDTAATIVE